MNKEVFLRLANFIKDNPDIASKGISESFEETFLAIKEQFDNMPPERKAKIIRQLQKNRTRKQSRVTSALSFSQ